MGLRAPLAAWSWLRSRAGLASVGMGTALAGCGLADPSSTTLAPRSDFGDVSHRIFLQILWWDIGIFALVAGILLWAIFRFRERDPSALPAQVRGNARFELTWTIAPAVVLAFIAFPTVAAIFESQRAPAPNALRVRVIGHQFWWEFQYPDLGIATASELHLPAGRAVALELTSPDVIHSFWVPQLGGKRDAVPGQTNRILMTPNTTGDYPGQCAEFCGVSHANMRHMAVVHDSGSFEQWVAAQKAAPPEPAEGSPEAKGLAVFKASACVGCHRIQDVSGHEYDPKRDRFTWGPDLSHFGSRLTIAGAMMPNTRENLARWIKKPSAVKPGSLMPDLGLGDQEVAALVAYLRSLK